MIYINYPKFRTLLISDKLLSEIYKHPEFLEAYVFCIITFKTSVFIYEREYAYVVVGSCHLL